jgi:hypothetical protein
MLGSIEDLERPGRVGVGDRQDREIAVVAHRMLPVVSSRRSVRARTVGCAAGGWRPPGVRVILRPRSLS